LLLRSGRGFCMEVEKGQFISFSPWANIRASYTGKAV
jgi:hypothetical protein